MITRYDIVYTVFSPLLLPYFAYRYIRKRKSKEPLKGMLGSGLKEMKSVRDSVGDRPVAWFYAVSMGEVNVTRAVIQEFKRRHPEYEIFVSTRTETGQNNARRQLKDLARLIFYHPADFSPILSKFFKALRPTVFVMMETEFWPNTFVLCRKMGVKIFLINGKMSERSYRGYRPTKWIFSSDLASMTACAMQTEGDAERISDLMGGGDHVHVTGNCKFDIEPSLLSPQEKEEFLSRYNLPGDVSILVVGSTHPGEEDLVLNVFNSLRKDIPELRMILAPRHPERFDEVYSRCSSTDFKVSRSSSPEMDNPDIVIVDEMGKLAKLYGLGQVAVVGGSFANIGGHNLLEAAAHRIPVVYGPHMHAQKEITAIMNPSGGGFQTDKEHLTETLQNLFKNNEERTRAGDAAYEAAMQNRGSTSKTLDILDSYL
jgi:3-deoxy-D-manno-octulosonic-acid transferase